MTRSQKMLPGKRILPLVMIAYLLMPGTIMGKEVNRMTTLTITSQAFTDKGMIPAQFTCDGRDVNPSLEWGTTPTGTRTLALIMDDPDAPAGTWVHWVVWNIQPDTRNIKENSVPVRSASGTQQLETQCLRRALSAFGDASVLLQTIRPRHRPGPPSDSHQG